MDLWISSALAAVAFAVLIVWPVLAYAALRPVAEALTVYLRGRGWPTKPAEATVFATRVLLTITQLWILAVLLHWWRKSRTRSRLP